MSRPLPALRGIERVEEMARNFLRELFREDPSSTRRLLKRRNVLCASKAYKKNKGRPGGEVAKGLCEEEEWKKRRKGFGPAGPAHVKSSQKDQEKAERELQQALQSLAAMGGDLASDGGRAERVERAVTAVQEAQQEENQRLRELPPPSLR